MKNAIFWDIKAQFLPHKKHITSQLHSPANKCYLRLDVYMAMTMKNVAF
jgi:hypothetical protein